MSELDANILEGWEINSNHPSQNSLQSLIIQGIQLGIILMPRQSYREHKPYAQVLTAALLCQATVGDFPGHPEWHAFTAQDNRISLKASPAALWELIRHYSQRPDFPSPKTAIQQFSRRHLRPIEAIRDTLTDMGQDRLALTNETKRFRGSSKIRTFTLTFRYPYTDISQNLKWLFARNGEWDRRAQTKGATSDKVPSQIRQTQLMLEACLDQIVCHFPEDLSDFTHAQLKHITTFIPLIRIALEEYSLISSINPTLEAKLALTLGKLYLTEGNIKQAGQLFERCLSLGDLSEINGLHYLGVFYSLCENYSQAENAYLQALDLRQERFPFQLLNIASTHHNLSLVYIRQGEYQKANSHLNQALDLRKNEPFVLAHSLQLRGELLLAQGQPSESQASYQKALRLVSNLTNHKAVLIAECKRGLARLQAKQGNYRQGKVLWEEALQILADSDSLDQPIATLLRADLAAVNVRLGKPEAADDLYKEALSLGEKFYGESHSLIVKIRQDYEISKSIISQLGP